MTENNVISAICAELVKTMGPIAPIVIREKISSFGSTDKDFPMDKIGQLVERLSNEIRDEKNKAAFQKGAIDQIREFIEHAGV